VYGTTCLFLIGEGGNKYSSGGV
jgi:hypothetical protein